MKRFASLTAVLLLLCAVHLTAFAAEAPSHSALKGIADIAETDAPDDADFFAPSDSTDAVTRQQTTADSKTKSSESADEAKTEPVTEPVTEKATAPTEPATTAPLPAQPDPPVNHTAMIVVIACGAALLVLLLILSAILLRRKRPADSETVGRGVSLRGIPVQIEILDGACYNANLSFHLRRNLTVGTDKGCDLVFDDPLMQPMHAVITNSNGIVTIGECADAGVTSVGGMKIFAPNRLRSGDIVTIGSTTFRVFFGA